MAQAGAHTGMRWTLSDVASMYWDELMLWYDEAHAIYEETWGRLAPLGGAE